MFCMNCGKELPDNARFCMYCGTPCPQVPSVSPSVEMTKSGETQASEPVEKQLDRDALKIYLNDLKTLEYSRYFLESKLSEIKRTIENQNTGFQRTGDVYPFMLHYDGNGIYTRVGYTYTKYENPANIKYSGKEIESIFLIPNTNSQFKSLYYRDNQYYVNGGLRHYPQAAPVVNVEWININDVWDSLQERDSMDPRLDPYLLFATNKTKRNLWNGNFDMSEVRKSFFNFYHSFEADSRIVYKNQLDRSNKLISSHELYKAKYTEVNQKLKDAYDLNIVPGLYRDMYAITFINDFISTSNEPLHRILLYYNLEQIKQKLDQIIDQQSIIILQNAYRNSLDQQMVMQNSQMLRHLASINANTAKAAEYSRIAAINSDTVSWLQTLDFIFK